MIARAAQTMRTTPVWYPFEVSRRAIVVLPALIVAIGLVVAATELVLQDGRVIAGAEVQRDGDNYAVILESGQTIVLPVDLVREMRLTGRPEPPPKPPEPDDDRPRFNPVTGLTTSKPRELGATQPKGSAAGLVVGGKPQQLAGDPVRAPTTREQLEVFGEPAEFQKNIINPHWQPTSDWDMDPDKQNNFAPSDWAEDIVDHSWEPKSDWDMDPEKQNNFNKSTWSKGVIDNSWKPTDGFKK
jgi:hypothetical protein